MFAYCLNNPTNFVDQNGKDPVALQWWTSTMWWLCGADLALPVGDIIYAGGVIISGMIVLAAIPGSTSQIAYDEETDTYGSPNPNKNDDDDDDYYDDDSNFGGRQKIGKSKGNTPRNNQRQNKQFGDATKDLSPKQQRILHDEISGEGLGFHEILEMKRTWLNMALGLYDEWP